MWPMQPTLSIWRGRENVTRHMSTNRTREVIRCAERIVEVERPMRNPGDVNTNGQRLIRKTDERGNAPTSLILILRCDHCAHEYKANGFDAHERRCPKCQGGMPGL